MTLSRRVQGAATAETLWRPWLEARGRASLDLDGCVRADQRLVVLAPHPDDELLSCGGLLAAQADRGGAVLIVGVTDGEASHAHDPSVARGALSARREAERQEGLNRLGAGAAAVHRLRLPDGGVAALSAGLERELLALLTSDDVLVSTWRLDGHPDHDACGRSASFAARARRCRLIEAPVWMWHWASPGDPRVPWNRMKAFAVDEETQRRKAHALDAHRTQLEPRRGAAGAAVPPVLEEAIVQRSARAAEHYFI